MAATPKWGDANVIVLYGQDANGKMIPLFSSSGIATRNVDGAGVAYETIMAPKVQASASTGSTTELQTDTTGWVNLTFTVGGITTPSSQFLVFGWSYTANDQSAVKTLVDSWTNVTTGKIALPDGTVSANIRTTPIYPGAQISVTADPANTIKTWMIQTSGSIEVSGIRVVMSGAR